MGDVNAVNLDPIHEPRPERIDDPAGQSPALFPAFLKLAGRKCLVVGAGQVGQSKIEGLLGTGANVTVVAPRATSAVQAWAASGRICWHERAFETSDLTSALLVIVATSLPLLNKEIFLTARQQRVLCNVVDDPEHCDFYYPAVVRRGSLQIAVSTDGKSPALAQRLRKKLEGEFGPGYADWIDDLGKVRLELFASTMDPEARRRLLHEIASERSFDEFRRARAGSVPVFDEKAPS